MSNPYQSSIKRLLALTWLMKCYSFSLAPTCRLITSCDHHPHNKRCGTHAQTNVPPRFKLNAFKSKEMEESYDYANRQVKSDTQRILKKYGFGQRLVTLSNLSELPIPCELFENGNWKLGLIVGLKSNNEKKSPLLEVEVMSNDVWEEKVVDVGEFRFSNFGSCGLFIIELIP